MGTNNIIEEREKIYKEVLTRLSNEMLEEMEEFEKKVIQ
jgi:hypothetical protein